MDPREIGRLSRVRELLVDARVLAQAEIDRPLARHALGARRRGRRSQQQHERERGPHVDRLISCYQVQKKLTLKKVIPTFKKVKRPQNREIPDQKVEHSQVAQKINIESRLILNL